MLVMIMITTMISIFMMVIIMITAMIKIVIIVMTVITRQPTRARLAEFAPVSCPMAEESDARERGNAAFKAGENEKAVECFTQAIASDPSSHLLYSNRSAAYARLGQFTPALLDANKAIELKPDWFKGHSRRAAAYMGLRNWRPALAAFEAGLRLEPNNAYMLEEAARIKKLLEGGNAPSSSTPASNGRSSGNQKMHGVLSLNVLLFSFFYVRMIRTHFFIPSLPPLVPLTPPTHPYYHSSPHPYLLESFSTSLVPSLTSQAPHPPASTTTRPFHSAPLFLPAPPRLPSSHDTSRAS